MNPSTLKHYLPNALAILIVIAYYLAGQYLELANQYPAMPHYPTHPGQVKIPAGWLIEQCGWKGKKMGELQNYGVHEKQALVLVNYGGATGQQLWDLALKIQADVFQKFGINIQPEVNLIKA
jgi:UDP-N-acetylmuramate dehydrogenase